MRILQGWLIVISVLAGVVVYADPAVVDCSKKSLADAVREADDKNLTITFTGICNGPVVVTTDGLTLKGVGTAIIDGGGADALTLTAPAGCRSSTSRPRTESTALPFVTALTSLSLV